MKTYATLGPACCRAELLTELLDMGLTPGVRVRLIGTALLGDPLILLVRGSRVSIRRRLARQIILSGGEAE